MAAEPPKAIEVYYAYAQNSRDEYFLERLKKHLNILKKTGFITKLNDHNVSAGKEWEVEKKRNLNTASIILLLVSADFLDSNYCWDEEITLAIERHKNREARVIPVIFRPVDWEGTLFGKLQPLPLNRIPVEKWKSRDSAFLDIEQGIKDAIKELYPSRFRGKDRFNESQTPDLPRSKSPEQPSKTETLREPYVPPDPEQVEREVDAKPENTVGRSIAAFIEYARNNKDNFLALNEKREDLLQAAQLAYEKKAWAEVHEFWVGLNDWLESIGDWRNESQLTTWAIEANEKLDRSAELSQVMSGYSTYLGLIGKLSEEKQYAEMSLKQAKKSLDRKSIVLALARQGQILQDDNRELDKGHKLLEEAWKTSRGISKWDEKAFVAYLLGGSYNDQGDSLTALKWYKKSLRIAQQTESLRYKAYAETAIGNWMIDQNRLEEADKHLRTSQELKEKLGNKFSMTITLRSLARLENRRGNQSGARELFDKAISIYEEVGIYASLTTTLLEIGDLLMKEQKYVDAITYYRRAKEVSLEFDSISERVIALRRLGSAYEISEMADEALQIYIECLELLESSVTKDEFEFGIIHESIGDLYQSQKQLTEAKKSYEQARTYYKQSLELSEKMQEVSGIRSNLSRLAYISIVEGDFTASHNYLKILIALYEQSDERQGIIEALYDAGSILYERLKEEESSTLIQEQYRHVRSYFERSLEISEEEQIEQYIIYNLRGLVDISIAQTDYTAAHNYLERLVALLGQRNEQQQISILLYNVAVTLYDHLRKEELSAQIQEQYKRVRSYYERSLEISTKGEQIELNQATLSELIDISIAQTDYTAAHNYLERLVALLGQRNEQQQISIVLHNAAVMLYDYLRKEEPSTQIQEQYIRVRTYHERSLAVSEARHDEPGIMVSLNELMLVAITQGDSKASDIYLARLVELYEKRGERRAIGDVLQNVGWEWYDRGEMRLAENFLRRAITIGEELSDKHFLLDTSLILAQIESAEQRFEKAQAHLGQCIDIAKVMGEQRELVKPLTFQAYTAEMQNLTTDAEKYLREALTILVEQNSQEFDRLEVLAPLARLVQQSGDSLEAQQMIQQIDSIGKSLLEHVSSNQLFEDSERLGDLYLKKLSEPTKALELFEKIKNMKPNDPSILISLVRCYEMLGQNDNQQVNEIYLSLLRIFSQEVEQKFSLTALRRLAWVNFKMGDFDTAYELAKQVLALSKFITMNNGFFIDKERAQSIVSSIEYLRGQITIAREEITRAIELGQLDADLLWEIRHDIAYVISNYCPLKDASDFYEMLSNLQN